MAGSARVSRRSPQDWTEWRTIEIIGVGHLLQDRKKFGDQVGPSSTQSQRH